MHLAWMTLTPMAQEVKMEKHINKETPTFNRMLTPWWGLIPRGEEINELDNFKRTFLINQCEKLFY